MKKPEDQKPTNALTTAAETIGSTLGKLAVKAGLATSPAKPDPAVANNERVPRKKAVTPPAKLPVNKAVPARKATRKKTKKTQ
jgi:hypothetical protein